MYEVDREAEIIKYLPLVERVVQRLSIKKPPIMNQVISTILG